MSSDNIKTENRRRSQRAARVEERMKTKIQPKTYKNYINNEWVTCRKTREVINPFNGEVIGIVPEAGKKDVDNAVNSARQAFDEGPWRDVTAQQRGRILFAM